MARPVRLAAFVMVRRAHSVVVTEMVHHLSVDVTVTVMVLHHMAETEKVHHRLLVVTETARHLSVVVVMAPLHLVVREMLPLSTEMK